MELEIICTACGQKHKLPLDASGHYSGPRPCNAKDHLELQIDPQEWRATMETLQQKAVH